MYSLRKLTARCELFIMKHFHAPHSSRRILATLSPESQLRIYKCAHSLTATCALFSFSVPHVVPRDSRSPSAPSCRGKCLSIHLHDLEAPSVAVNISLVHSGTLCHHIVSLVHSGSREIFMARGWTGQTVFCCRGCAEAKATCTATCQACNRVLQQGEAFHISKALTSCGHEGCTGCVKVKAALTEFPALELIESWQDVRQGCL